MDNNGGNFGEAPNEKWNKFIKSFDEINSLDIKSWKPVHIIGYFVKKYYEKYNTKYLLKFNSPSPSKSFEVFQIKKLGLQLSSSPKILRDYIDWSFKERASSSRRFTSISFLLNEEALNFYKTKILLSGKKDLYVDRSTTLPYEYMELVKIIGPISTYGDLSFMYHSNKSGALGEDLSNKFSNILLELKKLGLEESTLERIV